MTTRLVGIYNADGGLWGELRYALGALRGQHCGLCDITHSWKGRRPDFDQACSGASLSMELLHRNEATPAQLAAAGPLPAVIAQDEQDPTWRLVAGPDALRACQGDPARLMQLLRPGGGV